MKLLPLAILLSLAGPAIAGPPIVPNPALTPGATLPVTVQDLCRPGYTKLVRDVPESVKRQVYQEYGIARHARGEYEVDHLISLELGGSNSIKNLWPESYKTQPWNAHVKDALEDRLHAMVCSGEIDLATAQREIATDWIDAYRQVFHTNQPLTAGRRSARRSRKPPVRIAPHVLDHSGPGFYPTHPTPVAGAAGQVWVNTKSGKYFHEGSRYYGKTKQGQYMTEQDAIRAGFVAAKGQ